MSWPGLAGPDLVVDGIILWFLVQGKKEGQKNRGIIFHVNLKERGSVFFNHLFCFPNIYQVDYPVEHRDKLKAHYTKLSRICHYKADAYEKEISIE